MSDIDIKRELEILIQVYEEFSKICAKGVEEAKEVGSLSLASHQRGSAHVCSMVVADLKKLVGRLEDRHD